MEPGSQPQHWEAGSVDATDELELFRHSEIVEWIEHRLIQLVAEKDVVVVEEVFVVDLEDCAAKQAEVDTPGCVGAPVAVVVGEQEGGRESGEGEEKDEGEVAWTKVGLPSSVDCGAVNEPQAVEEQESEGGDIDRRPEEEEDGGAERGGGDGDVCQVWR